MLVCRGRLLDRVRSNAVSRRQVPHPYQAVDVDGEDATILHVDEAADEFCFAARKYCVGAFVEASDRPFIALHLGQHLVVEDV